MGWRETLVFRLGPGLLGGITLGDWLRILREHRFAVAPSCLPRALAISAQSVQNSLFRLYENRRFGAKLEEVRVEAPLFVLGHWRSGTTHLHNLITVDSRFAFASTYQAFFPHTFLVTQRTSSKVCGFFFPRHRPMDNVRWSMASPQEDEFALCISALKSPCMGWVFPSRRDHHDRYLTFRGAPEREVEEWQAAFELFLRKLTWKHGRPLVLKSPPHTGRIRLLLRRFPDAKFVHIHRDPYTVFQSSRRTFQVNFEYHRLQRLRDGDLESWVLRQYRELYAAFFEERELIPEGHLHEVGFEALERDPVGQVRAIYEALQLPDFKQVEPDLRRYVDSVSGYEKNRFPELPDNLRRRIAREWSACFEAWGYPV